MSQVGLQPLIYDSEGLRGETAASIVVRYLDSNLPVIGVRNAHTVLIVGYRRQDRRLLRRPTITFVEHDDSRGPYREASGDWQKLIVATPAELYLTGEEAERIARSHLLSVLSRDAGPWPEGPAQPSHGRLELVQLLRDRSARVTTVAVRSNDFKRGVLARGLPHRLAAGYRQISMPLWIWVCEVARPQDPDNVIAEVLVDATSSSASRPPPVLAWRAWNVLFHADVDSGQVGELSEAGAAEPVEAVREHERRSRYLVAPHAWPSLSRTV